MKKWTAGFMSVALMAALLTVPVYAAQELTHRAYLCGYPDGTIRPDVPVTRAQLACVLARLAEDEVPAGGRVSFFDVPGGRWYSEAIGALSSAKLLPFGVNGWFLPDQPVTWQEFGGVLEMIASSAHGSIMFPTLSTAWQEKALKDAEQGAEAKTAVLSRAELARSLNSLLGRHPDAGDAQLCAAAWYWDNRDETAWYYADLIEASVDHTCFAPETAERWSAIG